MNDPADAAYREPKRRLFSSGCVPGFLFLGIILVFLFSAALGPIGPGIQRWAESAAMQQSRSINLMMFSYANDNEGNYPDGKSSTEVFQKLLDGGYCADPAVFYIPRAGKFKGQPGQKLKPENVCFDVTSGLDAKSSDYLPVVFSTGYRVAYVLGGDAVLITSAESSSFFNIRTWGEWWYDEKPFNPRSGIAVTYKTHYSLFIPNGHFVSSMNNNGLQLEPDPQAAFKGIIPHFISPDFKPDGKTYRQLTPDGALP